MQVPAVSAFGIHEKARSKILAAIEGVKPAAGGWKVLVVDQAAMRVISSVCKMFDIMEKGITVVEKLEISRQPFPNLEVLYFVSPSAESIDRIIEDWNPLKPKKLYAAAHLVTTSGLDDKLMEKIGRSKLVDSLKTLKELYVDFLAPETEVFHFDNPNSMRDSYTNNSEREVANLVNKLASVCATIGERPLIRYTRSHPLAEKVALGVDDRLKKLDKLAPVASRNRTTLIILDRTMDLVAPIIHEFTYQAMVYDLLEIRNNIYKYVFENNAGEEQAKEVVISEADQLWPVLRHRHIADTIQFVISNFNEFVKTNEAVAMQKKSKEVVSLKEMGDAMKAMPHYQEMLTKYSLHIHMANQCMKVYKHKRLEELGNAEQDIATGLNSEGSKVKNFVARATPLLSDAGLNADDRKRLLMILAACDELKESDRRALMERIPITPGSPGHIAFDALMSLRSQARLIPQSKDDKKREKTRQKEKKKRAAKADEVSYQLARYENRVQKILDDFVQGQLSLEAFPYVGNVDAAAIANEAQPVSLKSQNEGGWASKAKKSDVPTKEATTILGSRVILFMVGGMTYSEIRAAYEVGEQAQREILIGGPCIWTPKEFVDTLATFPH